MNCSKEGRYAVQKGVIIARSSSVNHQVFICCSSPFSGLFSYLVHSWSLYLALRSFFEGELKLSRTSSLTQPFAEREGSVSQSFGILENKINLFMRYRYRSAPVTAFLMEATSQITVEEHFEAQVRFKMPLSYQYLLEQVLFGRLQWILLSLPLATDIELLYRPVGQKICFLNIIFLVFQNLAVLVGFISHVQFLVLCIIDYFKMILASQKDVIHWLHCF